MVVAPFVLGSLREHRVHQLEAKLKAGPLWQEHDYVFCTLLGTRLGPNHVVEELKKLLKQAGLPDIRFHNLCHNAATLLLNLDVYPKVVQELLGHMRISMTMDIYSHVLSGIQEDAIHRLHDVLSEQEDDQEGDEGNRKTKKR